MAAKKEWTRNRGRQPVDDGVGVEVRFRNGDIKTATASSFDWFIDGRKHPMGWCDIMAWRRVRAPRKPVAIAPEHAPRPAVPEAKPLPSAVSFTRIENDTQGDILGVLGGRVDFSAPRRPRILDAVLAIVVAVGLIAAVCYVF